MIYLNPKIKQKSKHPNKNNHKNDLIIQGIPSGGDRSHRKHTVYIPLVSFSDVIPQTSMACGGTSKFIQWPPMASPAFSPALSVFPSAPRAGRVSPRTRRGKFICCFCLAINSSSLAACPARTEQHVVRHLFPCPKKKRVDPCAQGSA